MSKIISARITIEPIWGSPIDGLEMMCPDRGHFKELCDLFGYTPGPSEKFTLHIHTATSCFHLEGMGINTLRIVLDELSCRGLDLSTVEGMEARYAVNK